MNSRKRQVAFQYYEYTPTKKKVLKHNGKVYELSPYAMLWNNDCFYVRGYSESHGKIAKFRVDRMATAKPTDTLAVPKPANFQVEEYAKSVFSMYDKDTHAVTFRCEDGLMKSIIDSFGTKVETVVADGAHFTAEVEVSVSPTFFGWVVGFGRRRYADCRAGGCECALYRAIARDCIK